MYSVALGKQFKIFHSSGSMLKKTTFQKYHVTECDFCDSKL